MGWSFRRSVSFGPLRVNIGSRGVGYSIGGPGFRMGVRANGRRYVSSGIPGTGLRYQQTLPQGQGCALALLAGAAATAAATAAALVALRVIA